VVVIRYGAIRAEVIDAVKRRSPKVGLRRARKSFRSRPQHLIDHAVDTLAPARLQDSSRVTLARFLFLWHFRSILVVTIPLPLAVLGSFLFMRGADISSNIMSLGGIAIAIGVLVDAGIVMTENVIRQAEQPTRRSWLP
jgi:Cu(I)/Ag(I) efflux system membrane protein CusA/SilA